MPATLPVIGRNDLALDPANLLVSRRRLDGRTIKGHGLSVSVRGDGI
jgi:hypothetical protein